ncbi:unnamed protein product [Pedinophyceae sp. YPF-701]|nr:unnamed protein product [Pedinophyceae sp. YPF-701]
MQPADAEMAEPAAEDQPAEEELVTPPVDAETLAALKDMGFTDNRAVRALYFSGNSTLEGALNWLEEHAEDADIDDDLKIPKSEAEASSKKGVKLTKEELEDRIRRAREFRKEQDKKAELESEKLRLKMAKELAAARRIEEEKELERARMQREREKQEEREAREAMRRKLEADKRDRLRQQGLSEEEIEKRLAAAAQPAEEPKGPVKRMGVETKPISALTAMRDALVALKRKHGDEGDKAKVAFTTLMTYVRNIAGNPAEEKFRRIRLANAAFQSRVAACEGGRAFLEHLGFAESDDGYLVLPQESATTARLRGAFDVLEEALTSPFFGAL